MSISPEKLRQPLAILLAGLGLAGLARAEDENPYFSELPLVASASRLPQRLADAPTAVTVIDRDLIKASGARDLNDIFRLVPGFLTYPNNTESARVTYHGLSDGDYSSRLQVLIDGRSMYSPLFGGGVNWATLPVALEDIERIEVVRGTNAVSYGSNAFLGVINIITVDPALVRGSSIAASQGNQNVRDYYFRTGGQIGEVGDFRFTYKQVTDDALSNRANWVDSYASRVFDLRADFALNDRDSLQFSVGQAEGITQQGRIGEFMSIAQLGGVRVPVEPIRDMRQTDIYGQIVWRHIFSPSSDMQFRFVHSEDRSDDTFVVSIPSLLPYPINRSGDAGVRDEIELQHNFKLAGSARLVWGASWRNDALRSKWFLPGQGTVNRETTRLFGNVEWKPTHWFTGNFGVAGENDTLAGFNSMPRVSANFHLNPENTLRIGYSRAYRTASTISYLGRAEIQLQQLSPLLSGSIPFYSGARDLPPERLDTWEIGYLGDWRDWRSSLDVRLFNERIHNRQFQVDLGGVESVVPIQNVRIKGLEFQFKWQPFEATRVLLNQTFSKIDSAYLASALALPNTNLTDPVLQQNIQQLTDYSMPGNSSSLLLMQKLPFGLDFSVAGYWQDKMKWTTNTRSPGYERYDARLAYPFRYDGLGGEVALTVQSLNGDHKEYKASDTSQYDRIVERRQWVSLRLDF